MLEKPIDIPDMLCYHTSSSRDTGFLRGGKDLKIFERVRKYLDDNGIKHGVIARKAGIPANTFSAIMCGKRTMYAEDYEAICVALNVPATMFINNQSA
jgi:hypothetical protein